MAMEATKRAMHLGALGSVSLRVVLALAASTGLTAAVALPMAYQAHAAQDERDSRPPPPPSVLGTSTVPGDAPAVPSDGLHWTTGAPELPAAALEGAEIAEPARIFVAVPQLVRVDIRLGDEPTRSDFEEPFELRDGQTLDTGALEPGDHTVTATLTFDDGRTDLRQATFTVPAR
ncbi:MAG: hypothetical protein M3Y51_03680 [Actinomycetota bacterium]|nr:hypothetical protein [Actinomycetota bacterium]